MGFFSWLWAKKELFIDTELQLKSPQAQAFFDAKKLSAFAADYKRITNGFASYAGIEGNYSKYILHQTKGLTGTALTAGKMRALANFLTHYQKYLEVIQQLEALAKDFTFQEVAGEIRDIEKMTELINLFEQTTITIPTTRLDEIVLQVQKVCGREMKRLRKEAEERQEQINHRNVGAFYSRWWFGLTGGLKAIRRKERKVNNKEYKEYIQLYTTLKQDITQNKVTLETIDKLLAFFIQFDKMSQHQAAIDEDLQIFMSRIFWDFRKILQECVAPILAAVSDLREAAQLEKSTATIRSVIEKRDSIIYEEIEAEKQEVASLQRLIQVCTSVIPKLKERNKVLLAKAQEKLAA